MSVAVMKYLFWNSEQKWISFVQPSLHVDSAVCRVQVIRADQRYTSSSLQLTITKACFHVTLNKWVKTWNMHPCTSTTIMRKHYACTHWQTDTLCLGTLKLWEVTINIHSEKHYNTQIEPQLACFYSLQVSLVLIQLIGLYIAVAEIFLSWSIYFIPFLYL